MSLKQMAISAVAVTAAESVDVAEDAALSVVPSASRAPAAPVARRGRKLTLSDSVINE